MTTENMAEGILITAITPYFLEKEEGWLAQNREKILASRAVNPFFQEHTILLENGGSFSISQLLLNLDTMGYEKVFHVQCPGEFSNRGNIVEVFPLFTPRAFRVEFLGNTIDQIEQLAIFVEDEEASKKILRKRFKSQKTFSDLSSLKEGDFLVHLDHGVARFMGIEQLQMNNNESRIDAPVIPTPSLSFPRKRESRALPNSGSPIKSGMTQRGLGITQEEYYKLEYAAGDTLYIPMGLERKLSRYVGFEDPRISRLGSSLWIKTKKKAREDIEKLAKSLLKTYAEREVAQRPPYPLPDDIDATIEASFPHQETADQVQALQEIHRDLSQTTPMDRIVCGDVGFGKTEIALRAMVRVAKTAQTALLCPTTILAHQHFQTFQKRLGDLPFRVAMLSRLQKPSEQTGILKGLASGTIDIVIGTHRLLSKDIVFRNLGLLVIDDEHRFGVKQKEKLKDLRSSLDVLSLSATPIPRTMHMALSSLRKVSMVQTPPEGRVPSSTIIAKRTQSTIKKAILQELERGGQVYYLHNRIASMGRIIAFLSRLVPKARIGCIHGRMREQNLIATLDAFRNKEYDVLVATTIIENGLHLPQVNTIIVEEASKIGLAQAYQLRGRVGRSDVPAFSYFLHGNFLGKQAKARLEALSELQDLGSGYRLALRDMEIRGAGNLLGKEQSGTVNAVGLNLYCQMLSESVERLRSLQSSPS